MNEHRRREPTQGLPPWLTATVILSVLGMLGYSIVVFGPKGYPIDMMLGGLLGAYGGLDQLIKRRNAGAAETSPSPAPSAESAPPPGG